MLTILLWQMSEDYAIAAVMTSAGFSYSYLQKCGALQYTMCANAALSLIQLYYLTVRVCTLCIFPKLANIKQIKCNLVRHFEV